MSATLISPGEYLATSFHPDRDYIDGEVLERNMGEWDHSRLQALLLKQLLKYEDPEGLLAVPEQRVQVKPTRFRVPDLSLVIGNPGEQILTQPPLLVIEVLSPEDSCLPCRNASRITWSLASRTSGCSILGGAKHSAFRNTRSRKFLELPQ